MKMENKTNKEDILVNLIKTKVKEMWDSKEEPYLLSSIGTDFKDKDALKETLNKKRLKEWIKENEEKLEVELRSHPIQNEKIGIIPKGEHFEYKATDNEKNKKKDAHKEKREITLSFISILRDLPEDELNKIIIPTNTLVKLLGE